MGNQVDPFTEKLVVTRLVFPAWWNAALSSLPSTAFESLSSYLYTTSQIRTLSCTEGWYLFNNSVSNLPIPLSLLLGQLSHFVLQIGLPQSQDHSIIFFPILGIGSASHIILIEERNFIKPCKSIKEILSELLAQNKNKTMSLPCKCHSQRIQSPISAICILSFCCRFGSTMNEIQSHHRLAPKRQILIFNSQFFVFSETI